MATAARRSLLGGLALVSLVALALPRPSGHMRPRPAAPVVTIGFIGDSLSALRWAGRQTVPDLAVAALGSRDRPLDLAQSGTTSADWLPQSRTGSLPAAMVAFRAAHVHLVHVMLGTNDSRDDYDVPPAVYAHHLQIIVGALRRAGLVVVLSAPPYAVPGSLQGVVSPTSDARLRAYERVLRRVVDGQGVLLGDDASYGYFAHHARELRDGVHPTPAGARALARLWARALARAIRG